MMRMIPLRLTTLHLSQMRLTDARTFIVSPQPNRLPFGARRHSIVDLHLQGADPFISYFLSFTLPVDGGRDEPAARIQ